MASFSFPKLSRELLTATAMTKKKAQQSEAEKKSSPSKGNGKGREGYAQPGQSARGLQRGRFLCPTQGVNIIIPGTPGNKSKTLKEGEVLDLVRKRVRRVQDIGLAWSRANKQEIFEEIERKEQDVFDRFEESYWANVHEAFFKKEDNEALQMQQSPHQGAKKND